MDKHEDWPVGNGLSYRFMMMTFKAIHIEIKISLIFQFRPRKIVFPCTSSFNFSFLRVMFKITFFTTDMTCFNSSNINFLCTNDNNHINF